VVVDDDRIVVREMMNVSLSFDHRVSSTDWWRRRPPERWWGDPHSPESLLLEMA
jgi:hypothetical protein